MLPILIRPQCSSSAAVAAAFHPERVSYFLLAFADGTAAVFDATQFLRKHERKDHTVRAAATGTGGVLAFMKGLHAQGTTTSKLDGVYIDGIDAGTGIVGIGDKTWGITAIAFVPGRKATVVTAGADGKCCVVDFKQTTKRKAVLLKTWHLRRPATSLSVICSPPASTLDQLDGPDHAVPGGPSDSSSGFNYTSNESYYIAVGRHDGRVLLFDLNGKSLGEQTLNESGAPIIDVEWTQAKGNAVASRRNSSPPISSTSDAATDRKALGTLDLYSNRPVQAEGSLTPSKVAERLRSSLFELSTPHHIPREQTSDNVAAVANHLDMIQAQATSSEESIVGDDSPQSSHRAPTTPSNKTVHRTTVLNSAESQSHKSPGQISADETTPPPIPPRPSPRPGGLFSMRRAHTDYSYQAPAEDSYLSLVGNARNLRNNPSLKANGIFGPRPMRSRDTGSPLKSAMTSYEQTSSGQSEVAWSDVPPRPPPHGSQLRPNSPTASIESFQTASSQVYATSPSERSTDTIVDWDVGPVRQPMPSLEEDPQQTTDGVVQKAPNRHVHVNPSISPTSHDSPTPTSTSFTDTASPVVQWPAFSPQYSGLGLHASHPSIESPAKAKPKQKGHISVPLSSASFETSAPASSASGDLVVQWPSLKKSPRIPELNKALSMSEQDTSIKSVRESATGFLLQTYMGAPSRPEAPSVREDHLGTCRNTVETTLHASFSAFRAELAHRFDEQEMWLERLIKGDNEGKMALEEENLRLRAEVASLKKDLGQRASE